MTPRPLEGQAIAKVAEDYRRQDYDADVAPSDPAVPALLADFWDHRTSARAFLGLA